jgi:hypothetical protein
MELTKVEVSSTNADTEGQLEQLATAGDTITLTVESSEALKSLGISGDKRRGIEILIPFNPVGDSGLEWTVSKTVESGDSGELSFTLIYEDLEGNNGVLEEWETTNNSKVTVE